MSQQVNVFRSLALRRGGTGNAKAAPIVTITALNTSGVTLARGDVVAWDITAASTKDVIACTTTTSANNVNVLGMVTGPVAVGGQAEIQIWGPTDALKVNGTAAIAIGAMLGTHTVAKVAAASTTGGRFARAMEAYAVADSNGVIDAFITNLGLGAWTTE